MPNPYANTDDELIDTYRRIHANGEQTHVVVMTAGEAYVATAYDIDPVDLAPVAAECVAYDPTIEGIGERVQRWMQANPRGVVGDGGGENGDGLGQKLNRFFIRMLKRLNEYGNRQMEDMHQQGGEQQ